MDGEKKDFGYSSNSLEKQSSETQKSLVEFTIGQMVFLKSNPSIQGPVIAIFPGSPENRLKVFIDNNSKMYYASQLQAKIEEDIHFQYLPCDQFRAYLTSLQILYPGLSTLYSLNAARIDFIPYQFRPVLKFIRSDWPRLLIADSVGVGKTIEAGLILRELQARREIKSILIICPRSLVTERKWELEMKRFDEKFTPLDGKSLRYCLNEMDMEGEWPELYQRAILPYSLFDETLLYGSKSENSRKRRKGLRELDPPPCFDVVIVDEAHHIRNQDTYTHKGVSFFCEHAEAVLFLTATPIQLGSHDLFVLLKVLRPDLILDQESFNHMAEPNPFINQAVEHIRNQLPEWTIHATQALDQAASTPWGQSFLSQNPTFQHVRQRLAKGQIEIQERIECIKDIEGLHTFSGIINRTRRRDIADFTIRKPERVVVEFSAEQKQLHDDLLKVQAEIFRSLQGDRTVNFFLSTIRRQAASCLHGLAPILEDILNRHLDELDLDEAENEEEPLQEKSISSIHSQIRNILERAKHLDPFDPKLEAIRKIIRNKQTLPNNKIIIFSTFRHTLFYLFKNLFADNFRIALIHGGTPDEERTAMRNRFEKLREEPDCIDILLFSEIGSEGLDYQFCDCIVNYDIPWNPMRIEQRIGRIDRKGQKSESIAIFNLITPGTVDAEIYDRCLVRLGIFNSALGGSEEILGEIAHEIKNIAENYTLTEGERNSKLQQLADNKVRLIQEQEELEERQKELFGIQFPQEQMKKEIEDASSFWLSQTAIFKLVTLYLNQIASKDQESILGEKPLKTLRLSIEARNYLLRDFQQLPKQSTNIYREWEKWLKGGNPHLAVTFESDCAMQHPEAAFIMSVHPLVKQAAAAFGKKQQVITSLKVKTSDVPEGRYEFAIYLWHFHGIKDDLVIRPIALCESLSPYLGKILEQAEDDTKTSANTVGNGMGTDASLWEKIDNQHQKGWREAREKHRQQTKVLASYRKESLSISHRARMALLEEKYQRSSNERIMRMHLSQIEKAKADYGRRIQELDRAIESADITVEPIAFGIMNVS